MGSFGANNYSTEAQQADSKMPKIVYVPRTSVTLPLSSTFTPVGHYVQQSYLLLASVGRSRGGAQRSLTL